MKTETLKRIKQAIREFADHFDIVEGTINPDKNDNKNAFPQLTYIKVIIMNMAFNGVGCSGYSHDNEVTELRRRLKCLRSFAEYNNTYMEWYPYNQISMIITAEEMMEDEEIRS